MKPLLILLLVLGMASNASAFFDGIYGTYDGATYTIDGLLSMDLYLIFTSDSALGPLSDAALGAAAPSMSAFATTVAPGDGMFGDLMNIPTGQFGGAWVMASAPGEAYVEGNLLTLSMTADPYYGVGWYDELSGAWEYFFVPEPMTVALLGLGGLLMLRRSR